MRLYAGDMTLNGKDEKKYVEIQTFNFLEKIFSLLFLPLFGRRPDID